MKKAKGQADRYVRSLPAEEGNPPFVLVVDVGHVIEVYADFSRLGTTGVVAEEARLARRRVGCALSRTYLGVIP